ncbi:hypothetical protein NQ318_010725 [Aromia moschata]|uniref:Uncharacterized protein n=1 Tax=Aromia moschata TaxID=1265417 RepID=A0AAV8YL71_9CUCU|nr:hypothetical protein NQ318_010725 [Aromia moschata]
MAFLAWLATAHEDGNISSILWTDESRFHKIGTINRHNCHYWSEDNPHWMRETNFQRNWGINMWCGMIDGYIIGPKESPCVTPSSKTNNYSSEEENLPTKWIRQDKNRTSGSRAKQCKVQENKIQKPKAPTPLMVHHLLDSA